jgi:hypothetical protein
MTFDDVIVEVDIALAQPYHTDQINGLGQAIKDLCDLSKSCCHYVVVEILHPYIATINDDLIRNISGHNLLLLPDSTLVDHPIAVKCVSGKVTVNVDGGGTIDGNASDFVNNGMGNLYYPCKLSNNWDIVSAV